MCTRRRCIWARRHEGGARGHEGTKAVIVDTKVIDRITDLERGQMLNYLRITKLRVGLILNFKKPKLEFERVVL